jgi:hypothetical protein
VDVRGARLARPGRVAYRREQCSRDDAVADDDVEKIEVRQVAVDARPSTGYVERPTVCTARLAS